MRGRRLSLSIRQHNTLPGVSLVEVVVAMGIASILMGISMTTMHTVLRADRETSKAAWLGSSFHRFSRLIRADIHAASRLTIENAKGEEAAKLTIQLPGDEVVTYQIEGHRIFRVVTRNQQRAHQDLFYLPAGSHASFFRQPRLNLAGIAIEQPDTLAAFKRKSSKGQPGTSQFSIASTIGHDYRLSKIIKQAIEKQTN